MLTSTEQINFFNAEHKTKSYQTYQFLREQAPLYQMRDPLGEAYWVITRYEDVLAVLKDPRFIKNLRTAMSAEQIAALPTSFHTREFNLQSQNMLSADPPRHTRLRSLV